MILARRSFLTGLGASLIAAPAIVRASSLMKVKSFAEFDTISVAVEGQGIVLMDRNYLKAIAEACRIPVTYLNPGKGPIFGPEAYIPTSWPV